MKTVDTRGQACPAPLIATRRALKEAEGGEAFLVLTDSQTSFSNITRYLKDNNIDHSASENDGVWSLTVKPAGNGSVLTEAEDYCSVDIPHFDKGEFVIAFSSDKMGNGDDDLGKLLMLNFVKAVKDLDTLPGTMVFYNSGVMLGRTGTETAGLLKELETMGVRLFFCATCLNHFGISAEVKSGISSNMFEIVQAMASAKNVIRP